jgi:hypothetical protein
LMVVTFDAEGFSVVVNTGMYESDEERLRLRFEEERAGRIRAYNMRHFLVDSTIWSKALTIGAYQNVGIKVRASVDDDLPGQQFIRHFNGVPVVVVSPPEAAESYNYVRDSKNHGQRKYDPNRARLDLVGDRTPGPIVRMGIDGDYYIELIRKALTFGEKNPRKNGGSLGRGFDLSQNLCLPITP